MRSDPDVVLIGEIRDRTTTQLAVEAALTGHLVLSTLQRRTERAGKLVFGTTASGVTATGGTPQTATLSPGNSMQ
ncbi:ATPase, T2SS/T4P/T4SS family [Dactylosporangium sp. NPDC049140]|uniref:ATPase, T2SS/T4P/T4SS family n=1 Tax=Dactylosporangium sp. NPDC049140 TaxID=3155647 RepID=UPI0033EE050E